MPNKPRRHTVATQNPTSKPRRLERSVTRRLSLQSTPEEDQKVIYREVFNLFDRDHNGIVTRDEVQQVLQAVGEFPTSSQMMHIWRELDATGKGWVTEDQFLQFMMNSKPKDKRNLAKKRMFNPFSKSKPEIDEKEAEIRAAFEAFDVVGDGLISSTEFLYMMQKMGMEISQDEVELLIQSADKDGDGKLNLEEFKSLMI